MKKKILIGLIMIGVFGYGLVVGSKQVFPYNQIKYLKNFISYTSENEFNDSDILSMNKKILPAITGIIGKENNETMKLLVIGNSLSYHSPLDNQWDYSAGMAASTLENDYIHLLLKEIVASKKVKVEYMISNIADFERNFHNFNYDNISNLIDFNPDIVIFQLGENVNSLDSNIIDFIPYYEKLISNFVNSKRIITTPFFPNENKNIAIRKIAINTQSYMVDLSNLTLINDKNLAKSEKEYNNKGIGMHPGDYGMKNIKENIYTIINVIYNTSSSKSF